MKYQQKYLKYKSKYLELKGGTRPQIEQKFLSSWSNKGFVLTAVTENGNALEYASQELRMDREVVLAAVT